MHPPPSQTKRIGRKRRTLGWTSLTLGVILLGTWFVSRWWTVEATSRAGELHVESGILQIARYQYPFDPLPTDPDIYPLWSKPTVRTWRRRGEAVLWRWHADYDNWARRAPPDLRAWNAGVAMSIFQFYSAFPSRRVTRVMLLPVAALPLASGAVLLRSGIIARRRATTSACPKCGYSLAGLAPEAPCPECGREPGTA